MAPPILVELLLVAVAHLYDALAMALVHVASPIRVELLVVAAAHLYDTLDHVASPILVELLMVASALLDADCRAVSSSKVALGESSPLDAGLLVDFSSAWG